MVGIQGQLGRRGQVDVHPRHRLRIQTAFFNTFAGRLKDDGDLTSQWSQVQQGAQGLAHTSSAATSSTQGLAELLRILALVLDGVLAVSNALLDGLLATITDFIQTMFAPDANGNPTSGGILTEPTPTRSRRLGWASSSPRAMPKEMATCRR